MDVSTQKKNFFALSSDPKTGFWLLTVAFVVVGAAVIVWCWVEHTPVSIPISADEGHAHSPRTTLPDFGSGSSVGAAAGDVGSGNTQEGATDNGRRQISPDLAEKYLSAASGKADALGALYFYTKDPAYLAAIKDRLALEPQAGVLLSIISYYEKGTPEDRAKILRQAHATFPGEAILTACLAGTEASLGNQSGALGLLGEIKDLSGLKAKSLEREQTFRDLLLLGGTNTAEAWKNAASREGENLFGISAIVSSLSKSVNEISRLPVESRIEAACNVVALARALDPRGVRSRAGSRATIRRGG